MCTSMIKSVRTKAGLGESPSPFYTNLSESLNRHLKRKVDRKQSSLSTFVDHMQALATQQRMQVEKAIIRKGSWRLAEQFSSFEVFDDIWFCAFTTSDREKRVKRLLEAKVSLSVSKVSQPEILYIPSDSDGSNNEQQHSSDTSKLSLPYSKILSDNIRIHEDTLKAMWTKAASLVNTSGMITGAPSNTSEFARMVASCSSGPPHFVSVPKVFTGQFLCDSSCPMFSVYSICAHVLATAEVTGKLSNFLAWFNKTLRKMNLTKLSNIGIPSKSGKKKNARGSSKRKMKSKNPFIATAERIKLPDPVSKAKHSKNSKCKSSASQMLQDSITAQPEERRQSMPDSAFATTPTSCFSQLSSDSGLYNFSNTNISQSFSPGLSITGPLQGSAIQVQHSPTFQSTTLQSSTSPISQSSFQILTSRSQHSSPYPFTLKFLNNRIQKCQGCQLQFRQHGVVLQPPHDLIISRLERRPFMNQVGMLHTPWTPSHAHYHLDMRCIRAADSSFVPSSLVFPGSVRLQLQHSHKEKLMAQFGLIIP